MCIRDRCTPPQNKPVDVVIRLAQQSLLSGEQILRRKTKETKEDVYYVSVQVLHADLIRVRIQHKRETAKD